jgi:membrane protein
MRGEGPLTDRAISRKLEIPIRLVNEVLFDLVRSRIVSIRAMERDGERGYQPALDINSLSIHYVIGALERRGLNVMPFNRAPEFDTLSAVVEAFGSTIEKLPDNKLLKDL